MADETTLDDGWKYGKWQGETLTSGGDTITTSIPCPYEGEHEATFRVGHGYVQVDTLEVTPPEPEDI